MSNQYERILRMGAGLVQAQRAFPSAYEAGRDGGLNGSNEANTHFGWFATKASMQEWERGKREAVSAADQP
jgi:hypothetical protein